MGQTYSKVRDGLGKTYRTYRRQQEKQLQSIKHRKNRRLDMKGKTYKDIATDNNAELHEEEDAADFLEHIKTMLRKKDLTTEQKNGLKEMLKTQNEIVNILHHRADRRNEHKY